MGKYIYTLYFIIAMGNSYAQNSPPMYTLYMYNPYIINPAMAGKEKALNLMIHYKDQWVGFDNHPVTYVGSYDTPLKGKNFNIGGIFYLDKIGFTERTDIIQSVCYRSTFSTEYKISIGFSAGFSYRRYNFSQIDDGIDPVFRSNPGSHALLLGGGIYFNTARFFVGVSNPNSRLWDVTDFDKGYQPFYFTTGYTFYLSKNFNVTPSLLYKFVKTINAQTDFNAMLNFKQFAGAGFSFRTNNSFQNRYNSVAVLTELAVKQIKIGYAFDYFINPMQYSGKGSHEIVFKYHFKYILKAMDPRTFN